MVDLLKDVLENPSVIFLVTFSLIGTDDRKSNGFIYTKDSELEPNGGTSHRMGAFLL